MRINVYGEELTFEHEIVHKVVDERNFYGIRLFLESSPFLHQTSKDDDRSAVTLWVPWTHEGGNDFRKMANVISGLYERAVQLSRNGSPR